MSIKLLLLKSGEEVITEAKEILDPETKDPVGFHLHKPFRVDIVSNEEQGVVLDRKKGYQVSWFPWAPLSKDRDFYLPGHHVLTAYDPLDSIAEQYLLAIKEENYEKNFKAHEDTIAGIQDEDLDMEQLFKEAEQLLEEENGDQDTAGNGDHPTVGDKSDQSGGTTGGGTELPPTGSVPNQG
jgi:hypothetical protein|tara:strand:- start:393 stop:938 length:546 start_codon:yes stop_codon:yes gene_type:complete